jgi:hypothetical protein
MIETRDAGAAPPLVTVSSRTGNTAPTLVIACDSKEFALLCKTKANEILIHRACWVALVSNLE